MRLAGIVHGLPTLLGAALTTLEFSVSGIALGAALGVVVCVARLSGGAAARAGALYVSVFRGVPLLVLLLVIYYLLPLVGLNVPASVAAIAGLGLSSGAYQAEILRGALGAVPRGQAEAAAALGLAPVAIWRRILLPQALRLCVPPLIGEFILLVKASSLISVVGIAELTRAGMSIASITYRPLEAYLAIGVMYLVINAGLAAMGAVAERRLRAA